MRAAILLIPFAAFAGAWSAGAFQSDPYGDNAMADARAMNDADSMDMNIMNAAADLMDMPANYTAPENDTMMMDGNGQEPPNPVWLAGHMWLRAGAEAHGPVWYFDPLRSNFDAEPHRVWLRLDETPDTTIPYRNTLREVEMDCAAGSIRTLRTTHYDFDGNATVDEDSDGRMNRPAPGSGPAQVIATVCRHVVQHDTRRRR